MINTITKKQAIYLLLICLIGTKFQRLPSFLSDVSGKGFWGVFLIYLLIDGLFLMLALKIINLSQGATLSQMLERVIGKFFSKIILIMFGVYFFIITILPYESVHEVFSDIIFDSLPWKFFALFLLIAMGVIAVSGLRNIGRMCQMFFYLIAFGVLGLFALGFITSDLSVFLPIYDIDVSSVLTGVHKSSLWFGNFMILFVFMGKIENQQDKKWKGIKFAYLSSCIFVTAMCLVFYGIYEHVTPLKRNLLTKISQFSLLSLDIGRPDWFLILFAEFATILTAGIFIFCSAVCFKEVIKSKKINFIIYILLLMLYLITNFFVKSKLDIFRAFISYGSVFGIIMQYIIPLLLLILAFIYNKKYESNKLISTEKQQKGNNV